MNETMIIIGLVVVIIIINLQFKIQNSKIKELEHRMKNLQLTVAHYAKDGAESEPPINKILREMIIAGKPVAAVKEARQALGLSLVEAKQYVDRL